MSTNFLFINKNIGIIKIFAKYFSTGDGEKGGGKDP